MKRRKTSAVVRTGSRNSSAARRAPIAAASIAVSADDASTLDILIGHYWGRAKGEPGASRRLAGYRWALRKRGRHDLDELVEHAFTFDGGVALARLARDAQEESEEQIRRGVTLFVRTLVERDVRSTSAAALILRGVLQGNAVDYALVRLHTGKGTGADATTVARFDAPARLNVETGLQGEQRARDERPRPSVFDWSAPTAPPPIPKSSAGSSSPAEDGAFDGAPSPEVPPPEAPSSGSWVGGGTDGASEDDQGRDEDGPPGAHGHASDRRGYEAPGEPDYGGFDPCPDVVPADTQLEAAARAYREQVRQLGFPVPSAPTPKGAKR